MFPRWGFSSLITSYLQLAFSISGKTLSDNLAMLDKISQVDAGKIACVELNLACPNVIGKPVRTMRGAAMLGLY